jgi:hypothetical protein
MSTHAPRESAQASLKTKNLQERLLLQAESMFLSGQLQNFAPLRDRLMAAGQDAAATYRQMQSRLDELTPPLTKLARIRPAVLPPVRDLTSPLAAPVFLGTPPGPSFGFAGSVRMGTASEFANSAAPGVYGTIETMGLYDSGLIQFTGDINGIPVEGYPSNPGPYNPKAIHLWSHSWYYRVPFPAPPVTSMLTYGFEVQAQAGEILVSGGGFLMLFVTLGETANFVGQDIPIDTLAGLPFAGQLTTESYFQSGSCLVQRSFAVNAGNIPAIEVVVGVVAALQHGEFIFDCTGICNILPTSTGRPAADLISFRYDPIEFVPKPPPL